MLADLVYEFARGRIRAHELFFGANADRIVSVCRCLADGFANGGRLLAVGGTSQQWSDARHVAVEFVHPVIVGKRALPAIALAPDDIPPLRRRQDSVIAFDPLVVEAGGRWLFEPLGDDAFVRQELEETLYHVLWELVHVFFEHDSASSAGGGASSFLYPFLDQEGRAPDAVEEDVRRSVLMKAAEVAELRAQTLTDGNEELGAAAAALRASFDAGGKALVFGNGGSATDAMDLVADFRSAPQGWPARPAIDLAADPAIVTALANDIGFDNVFQRQVIAYGAAGDVAIALSTSGGSGNVIRALEEARRRDLQTIAFVGYDGGRIAEERLADQVVVTKAEHIPRIQEAQASAYHVLRELVER